MKRKLNRKDMDMTSGVIWKQLVVYSIPLVIGYLFQQLYNTVDSIVVGRFVGKEALAAVGSVGPILNTLIGFFMGLAAGAGVAISQAFGARDEKALHDAVHTSLFLTAFMAVLITVLGIVLTPWMMTLMAMPEDVIPEAEVYLKLYFAGAIGMTFYNMGAGILRAVGDTRRPLYFLVFSAVVNTILDLLFVIVFKMGTAGVALATSVAQVLSAIATIWVLVRSDAAYRVVLRDIRADRDMLIRIIHLGIPTAIQQAVTAFSNVFVQGYINYFGSACMAGWSSYSKIDSFIMLPMQGVALASTTFAGQNFGAGNAERARRGNRTALLLGEAGTVLLMIPVLIFAPQLVGMFNEDLEVIHYGALFIRLMTPFYVTCVVNQIYAGLFRGAGDTRTPMFIMLGSFVLSRQIYLFIVSRLHNRIVWISMGYPFGWIIATILSLLHYRYGRWEPQTQKSETILAEKC